ncbi:MAG: DUF4429 domain-containing protein [Syntrophomonadaceae bacterium]|jgi:hypothetical protein
MLFELNGVNGQLQLFDNRIVISRKGALAKLTQGFSKGEKSIYLSQISSIQIKPGNNLTNGYIQFTISGGKENTKGLISATQDENTVMFKKKDNELVEKIRTEIERLKGFDGSKNHSTVLSPADEIRKYKELLDDGIITQDEFQEKKRELLG